MSVSRDEFMADPNKRQVGGFHYRGVAFQHWDFIIENQMGYLEGQVSKYVCRWRAKNGRQDLEKALHYLAKLIWAYENGKMSWPGNRQAKCIDNLEEAYKLSPAESLICDYLAFYTDMEQLREVERLICELMKGIL